MIASFSMIAILSTLVVSTAFAGTFSDVPADSPYYAAVEALAGNKVVDTTKTTFNGAQELQRSEAAKLAVLAAGYDLENPAEATFKDVAKTAWYYTYVETAVAHTVLSGYTDKPGYYGPNDKLTRAQYAKILVNALQLPEYTPTEPTFSDVPATHWSYKYVETAYHWSVVNGISGAFVPAGNVTRYQAAVMTNGAMNPVERPGSTPVVTGGALEVSLSSDTPDGGNIPGLVENAVVAKYDFTAGEEDVTVQQVTVTRGGLNDDGSVSTVALFDENGSRLSNAKSFNSSDNAAVINLLNNGLDVAAGKTVTVSVIAQVGDENPYSGQTFFMSIVSADDVVSNASDVTGDFPAEAETFAIGSVNAGTLEINTNGSAGDVKVGETSVAVAKFKVKNNSTANQKIEFSSITLKEEGTADEEEEVGNYELFIDGDSVAKGTVSGKYVSFMLDDAVTLEEGKSVSAVVKADILGGPTKTITFQVNSDLDVGAKDLKYGFGAQIDATSFNAAPGSVTIDAGQVTVVGVNATATDVLKDKKDVLLGTIKVTANAGKDLELQKVEVNIENTFAGAGDDDNVSTLIENVEIYDGSSIYDLDAQGADGDSRNFMNDDLSINLEDGTTTEFQVRVDTKDIDISEMKLVAKVQVIGTATKATSDFYIEETGDDNAVTDITPSTLTFKAVNGQVSGATASVITMSPIDTVVGTENVPALKFQIRAGLSSDITVDQVDVSGTFAAAEMSSSQISKISLYKGDAVVEANLVKSVTGSKITDGGAVGVASFDNLDLVIPKNTNQKFLVAVNLVDDEDNAGDLAMEITLASDISLKDSESEDVDCGGTFSIDGRTITLTGMGTLAQAEYASSSVGLNKNRNVLGNTTSEFVAGYEFTVANESVLLKDLTVTNEEVDSDLQDLVSEVILIGNDKTTELARETVSADAVTFTDVNVEMAEGTYKMYVKVLARKIGKNEVVLMDDDGYNLSLEVTQAEGVSSGKTVVDPAAVTATPYFWVVPVLADVAGGSLPSTGLKNGAPTTLAKVTVTPKTTTNTDIDTGALLKTKVTTLTFNVKTMSNVANEACASLTLKKTGTSDTVTGTCAGNTSAGNLVAGQAVNVVTFDVTGMSDEDNYVIDSATSYQVDGSLDVTDTQLDAYFELELDAADADAMVVTSDDTNGGGDSTINLVIPTTIELGETKFVGTGA